MDLSKIYLFRITHIDNIPHIMQYGITHFTSANSDNNYVSIGDSTLINKRNTKKLENGSFLGEFIPFYFGVRMPMLFIIQNAFNGVPFTNPEKIVYCITSVAKIVEQNLEFIFTDGHAMQSITSFCFDKDVNKIESFIDFKAVNARYWKDPENEDIKRKKEAEFLIKNDIPINCILGYAVYNKNAKQQLINYGVQENKVVIKQNYYF